MNRKQAKRHKVLKNMCHALRTVQRRISSKKKSSNIINMTWIYRHFHIGLHAQTKCGFWPIKTFGDDSSDENSFFYVRPLYWEEYPKRGAIAIPTHRHSDTPPVRHTVTLTHRHSDSARYRDPDASDVPAPCLPCGRLDIGYNPPLACSV